MIFFYRLNSLLLLRLLEASGSAWRTRSHAIRTLWPVAVVVSAALTILAIVTVVVAIVRAIVGLWLLETTSASIEHGISWAVSLLLLLDGTAAVVVVARTIVIASVVWIALSRRVRTASTLTISIVLLLLLLLLLIFLQIARVVVFEKYKYLIMIFFYLNRFFLNRFKLITEALLLHHLIGLMKLLILHFLLLLLLKLLVVMLMMLVLNFRVLQEVDAVVVVLASVEEFVYVSMGRVVGLIESREERFAVRRLLLLLLVV